MLNLIAAVTYLTCALFTGVQCPRTGPLSSTSDDPVFKGSDRYDFSFVIQAAEVQCFWHYARQGGYFFFSYEVQWATGISHDRRITATVNTPSDFLIGSSQDVRGQINFKTSENGFHQICLSNRQNHFGSMQIFLNFGVFYEGFGEEKDNTKTKELNDTLATIEESCSRVGGNVFHMWRYYNFGRMRRGADYYILQSNHGYVNWWSAIQSVVIVLSGSLQLYFLKRLFSEKTTTETQKPRC
ncbi:transmembrane emp24 domain-containing protein 6 [Protopterus annectens]|uniref:transmembrane emp24 domain-containing protein 6 n=1 Tax=Protopterus annectens TaxID=7888 RepID=UPI001CF9C489|nr:transmembrane emp24 domain-containing protein 6 [Protopterus annectens]